ncbi:MAG: hypothetical protein ACHQAX_09305 [Gammaproteobacteria bacterium]
MIKSHLSESPAFQDSLVAFLDILGFSDRFKKDRQACVNIIESFSGHNGRCYDQVAGEVRKARVSSTSFSDNIAISIPTKADNNEHSDDLYRPIVTFLMSLSFYAVEGLKRGFYLRGAIAYGEVYHSSLAIVGDPFIEAVEHEKIAYYPRIILSPSALRMIVEIPKKNHYYGWALDEIKRKHFFIHDAIDNTVYFDWLSFYHALLVQSGDNESLQTMKDAISIAIEHICDEISSAKSLKVLSQLNWLMNYLDKQLKTWHLS